MNLFFNSLMNNSKPFLFIINGESNSGGYALNSQAPSNEIGVRSSVSLLNPVSLVFESLNIGGNNILDHSGLSCCTTHGFELEIANRADTYSIYNGVKLIKTGHGGSTIAQWSTGGTYYQKFIQRINAAKSFIDFNNYTVVILFSLGINDAISGTNVNTWKSNVITHFQNMRNTIGQSDVKIIMTEFQGMGGNQYSSYITTIREISSTITNVYSVDVTSAGLRDTNHWDYYGMKYVSGKMLDLVDGNYNLQPTPTPSITSTVTPTPSTTQIINVTPTITPTISITPSITPSTPLSGQIMSWENLINTTNSDGFLNYTSSTSGGRGTTYIDTTQPFQIYTQLTSLNPQTVLFLDKDKSNLYGWGGSQSFESGVYYTSNTLYWATGDSTYNSLGPITLPYWVKFTKSGNDIILSKSSSENGTYTDIKTFTNVLVGVSTLYVHVLFAANSVGNKIQVKYLI